MRCAVLVQFFIKIKIESTLCKVVFAIDPTRPVPSDSTESHCHHRQPSSHPRSYRIVLIAVSVGCSSVDYLPIQRQAVAVLAVLAALLRGIQNNLFNDVSLNRYNVSIGMYVNVDLTVECKRM